MEPLLLGMTLNQRTFCFENQRSFRFLQKNVVYYSNRIRIPPRKERGLKREKVDFLPSNVFGSLWVQKISSIFPGVPKHLRVTLEVGSFHFLRFTSQNSEEKNQDCLSDAKNSPSRSPQCKR
eukprot:UN01021